jgi:HSP20 family protein
MKLPIQKTERRKEQFGQSSSEEGMCPMARSLIERILPEELLKPWLSGERNFYPEMEMWTPRVDVSETDKEFQINVDVPGAKPADINVEIAGDDLVIKGKVEEEKEEKGKTWHRTERRYGSFYREFELPKSADLDKIEAMVKDGMLMIKVQKKPEAQSKTIEVKSGGGESQQQQ